MLDRGAGGRGGGGGVRKDVEEAEMRGPRMRRGGRGGFKGCQDEDSDDFQPATFYCYDFPTASGFFSLHVQCHLSSRRGRLRAN